MENYKGDGGILRRVNSTSLLFAALLLITAGLIYHFLANKLKPVEITQENLSQTIPQINASRPGEAPSAPPPSQAAIPSPTLAQMNAAAVPETETQAAQSAPAVAAEGTKGADTQPSRASPQVEIEFAMMGRESLERLAQVSDGRLEIGRYAVAVIPQFHVRVKSLGPTFQKLATENRPLTLGAPSLVFRGGKEPKSGDEIGFFVEVTPIRQSDRAGEYKIAVKRSMPEFMPTGEMRVQSQEIEEAVILAHGSALALSGLLPRRPLVEGEDTLYRANILKALLEPAFQRGEEEFVILIHPHPTTSPAGPIDTE